MTVPAIIICALALCCLIALVALQYNRPSEISITDKAVDLADVLPIQCVSDDMIVNGNGDLTVGFRLFLPEVFTLSHESALHIHDRLEGLLKMLPAGTVVHQQCLYYTGAYHDDGYPGSVLSVEDQKYLEGKEVMNCYTNLYVTFTDDGGSGQRSASATSLLRKYCYPLKRPFKGLEERINEIEPLLLNLENGLSSITQIGIKRMDNVSLNNAIHDYLGLSYATPTDDATKEVVSPLSASRDGDMRIGDKHVAILSLTGEGDMLHELAVPSTGKAKAYGSRIELPENIRSKCSMLYPVGLGLPFNHMVNIVIEITDSDATQAAIAAEKGMLNFLFLYRPAKEKQKEQNTFLDELSQSGHQTAYTAFNVIIDDPDKRNLVRKTALAKQGFSFMNHSSCFVENAETCNLFFCNIPGNARANYRGFVNTTRQALYYLQKDSVYLSDLRGHVYCDRFGNPARVNLWDHASLNNRNKVVIGPSGSGKSFWLNGYVSQSHALGNDIAIMDIGGSYKSMIRLNHGKYLDSAKQGEFAFNPFLCDRDKRGRYIYLDSSDEESAEDLIRTISAILSYIWKHNEPMSPIEGAILRKSIMAFYEYANTSGKIFPSLISYRDFMRDIFQEEMLPYERQRFEVGELLLMMEPYTDGELSYLLNGTENIDIVNDDLIAFDMEAVSKKEYFPLVVIMTLQMIADKIKRRKGVRKELIIDEALDFLSDEKFGDFIAYLYRTFRKKEGAIMIAAQNVLFLQNCPPKIKDSILINCDTKVILDHSDYRSELPNLQNVLSITDDELVMIESLQTKDGDTRWREFFIRLGKYSYVFRNEVSPFSAVAFDSRESTVVRIKKLFEETGSTYSAINRYLEEKRAIHTN